MVLFLMPFKTFSKQIPNRSPCQTCRATLTDVTALAALPSRLCEPWPAAPVKLALREVSAFSVRSNPICHSTRINPTVFRDSTALVKVHGHGVMLLLTSLWCQFEMDVKLGWVFVCLCCKLLFFGGPGHSVDQSVRMLHARSPF